MKATQVFVHEASGVSYLHSLASHARAQDSDLQVHSQEVENIHQSISRLYQKTHNTSGSGGLRSLCSSCWSWCEAGSPPGAAGSLCSPAWLPLRVTWQETMEKIFFRPLKYSSVSASHESENFKVTDILLILMFQINSEVPLVLFSPFRQVILKVL